MMQARRQNATFLFLAGLWCVVGNMDSHAGTIRQVPSVYATITAAMNAAVSGDVIQIGSGVYNESITTTKSGLTFQGSGSSTIVSGGNTGAPFRIRHSNTTISNMALQKAGGAFQGVDNAGVAIDSGDGILVNQVLIEDCTYGVVCGSLGGPSVFPAIQRSTIRDCSFWAVDARGSSGPTVVNCLIQNSQSGIRIQHFASADIINNTIVNCSSQGISVLTSGNALLQNNAVCFCSTGIQVSGSATVRGNNAYGNGSVTNDGVTGNYSGFTPAISNLHMDPLFVNRSSGNYHLSSNSPCIDAGIASLSPNVDFDGNARPQGAGYDIGYDEVEAATTGYTKASLIGTYAEHDLLALLSGAATVRTGTAQFGGNGNVTLTLTGGSIQSFQYDVVADGGFKYYGSAYTGPTDYTGTVGMNGGAPLHAGYAAAGMDSGAPQGYAGFRAGVRLGTGLGNSRFVGSYSLHALLSLGNGVWRTVSGALQADGSGTVLSFWANELASDNFPVLSQGYVVSSNGRVAIAGKSNMLATLGENGAILVQTLDVAANEDPRLSGGYKGLAFGVRRGASVNAADFSGTYRVHEIIVQGNKAQIMGIGSLHAPGSGAFVGDIRRNGVSHSFNGSIRVNPSGTFYLGNSSFVEGALAPGGAMAVLTKHAGYVRANTSDSAWMEVWLRTSGGGATPEDKDGDGLSDADETRLGTNPNNPDSDADGLPDGIDPQPLIPNNRFTADPDSISISINQGDSVTPKTLRLANTPNPFFSWSISSNKTWLSVTPASGLGDGAPAVSINATTLTSDGSPYTGALTVTAPGMANSPMQIPVTVTVINPIPVIEALPQTLDFEVLEGDATATPKQVSIRSISSGERSCKAIPQADWITVAPTSWTTPKSVSIGLDMSKLSVGGTPYQGTVRIATQDMASKPVDVTVNVTVRRRPHPIETPFAVHPSSNAQTQPSMDYDPVSELYGVAWSEPNSTGSGIYVNLLNAEAAAVANTLLATSGYALNTRPFIVRNPGGGFFVIWERRDTALGPPDIQGRVVSSQGTPIGDVFSVAMGTLQERQPAAAANPDRGEVVVVYSSNGSTGQFDVYFLRFRADNGVFIAGAKITHSAAEEENPAVAYDAAHAECLVAWSEKSATPNQQRIRAVRVDAATGSLKGTAFTLQEKSGVQRNVRLALDTVRGIWSAVWDATNALAQDSSICIAQFPTGSTPSSIVTQTLGSHAATLVTCPAIVSLTGGEQFRALWSDAQAASTTVKAIRFSSDLKFQGIAGTPPGWPASGADAAVLTYNPSANEFFSVYAYGTGGASRVYAIREKGLTADDDNDGLPNDWEIQHGLNPFRAVLSADDADGDGLSDYNEFMLGTNPTLADTDGDGILDGKEDANNNGVVDTSETDPAKADTDNDGFDDFAERQLGSNPRDIASTPPLPGLYRIDYSTFYEGVGGTAAVYVATPATRLVTLNLNSPDAIGWNPPSGWQVTLSGSAQRTLPKGSHVFLLSVKPIAPITPKTAFGRCAFRVTDGASLDETLTAVMICDTRRTLSGAPLPVDELAAKFSPILRMHRDERTIFPASVDFALKGTLISGAGRVPQGGLLSSHLYNIPQEEASLELLGGSTMEGLYAAWDALRSPSDKPVLYYTATRLGNGSVEAGSRSNDIAIQYYMYYYFDDWGATTKGAHSEPGVWHMFQVLLDANGQPYAATATRQWIMQRDLGLSGAESVDWSSLEKTNGSHPILYIGKGGHSPYFRPGSVRYPSGLEVSDGLGTWLPPELCRLNRLGETGETPWLRYAGRWGGIVTPAMDDITTPSTGRGTQGPMFLGDTFDRNSATRVQSAWVDPWAWHRRAVAFQEPGKGLLKGLLPEDLRGTTVALLDARGRVFRSVSSAMTGEFQLLLPQGTYSCCVVSVSPIGFETYRASAVFRVGTEETTLFRIVSGGVVDFGEITLSDGVLSCINPYETMDSDGDGILDSEDSDMDDDGIDNVDDPDVQGDGWEDAFQKQDPNHNHIPRYYDSAEKSLVLDMDTDQDGFSDVIDLDIDNDGFENDAELAAGSSPYLFFDTPLFRLGDLDGDGTVDALDVQLTINVALRLLPYAFPADVNRDGTVDIYDVQGVIHRALRVN